MLSSEQLRELLSVLKDNGVVRFKTPELELEIRPTTPEIADIPRAERERLEREEEERLTFAHVEGNQ